MTVHDAIAELAAIDKSDETRGHVLIESDTIGLHMDAETSVADALNLLRQFPGDVTCECTFTES